MSRSRLTPMTQDKEIGVALSVLFLAFVFGSHFSRGLLTSNIHPRKLTRQWKIRHLKVYFLLKMVIFFQCSC